MGNYVQGSLISGEKVEVEASVSWASQLWWFVFAAIFISQVPPIYFIVPPMLFIATAVLNVLTTELAVTNKKVIGKAGFIRRTSIDLQLSKLESIVLDQGVIGRIFNFGTVVVRGTGGNEVGIPYIKSPLEFRRSVMSIVDQQTAHSS
ncbi:MAG: PH domain-containing protein [Candidatus Accumulibacter sp.]|jgi:uncharacterized membrane protein YdbT with pleckstrin-like domain|nr:PH domain-containing protein [Accumulibacter sp.]